MRHSFALFPRTSRLHILWAGLLLMGLSLGAVGLPAAESGEEATPPPPPGLELTVRTVAPRSAYGDPIKLTVRVHNPARKAVTFYNDHRLGGVLRLELIDDRGLIWRPAGGGPLVLAPIQVHRRVPGLSRPLSTVSIGSGKHIDIALVLTQFEPLNGPTGSSIRWFESLAPGRYRIRAVVEKKDDRVPAAAQPLHVRMIPPQPARPLLRSVPGLWTGRLQATAHVTVTAPQTAEVAALRLRVQALKASNQALRKQLAAIREIVRGG